MIETKDARYIYQFAKEVKNLSKENIDTLAKGIIKTKNAGLRKKTCKNILDFEKKGFLF